MGEDRPVSRLGNIERIIGPGIVADRGLVAFRARIVHVGRQKIDMGRGGLVDVDDVKGRATGGIFRFDPIPYWADWLRFAPVTKGTLNALTCVNPSRGGASPRRIRRDANFC